LYRLRRRTAVGRWESKGEGKRRTRSPFQSPPALRCSDCAWAARADSSDKSTPSTSTGTTGTTLYQGRSMHQPVLGGLGAESCASSPSTCLSKPSTSLRRLRSWSIARRSSSSRLRFSDALPPNCFGGGGGGTSGVISARSLPLLACAEAESGMSTSRRAASVSARAAASSACWRARSSASFEN
jgi:hypothetical protein